MITHIAYSLDALLTAFAFGATVWFFFVQSPVLIRWMGKEKFIPIQMKLTRALFSALAVAVLAMAALSFVHSQYMVGLHVVTAAIAVFGALVNAFIVVPRALRAGGQSMKEVRSRAPSHSVSDFASRGGGDASKVWHRLVVLFVVVMLGGLVAHGSALLSHPQHPAAAVEQHHHGDEPS